jgi:hypothetical protein
MKQAGFGAMTSHIVPCHFGDGEWAMEKGFETPFTSKEFPVMRVKKGVSNPVSLFSQDHFPPLRLIGHFLSGNGLKS